MNIKPSKASAPDLRMSAAEFDRIMGKALQVKPQDTESPKKRAKPKASNKKHPKRK